MNTPGAVKGGVLGGLVGALGGFFTAHALSPRSPKKRHQTTYTAGGAALGAAIGSFFGGQSAAAAATLPPGGRGGGGVTNTTDNGAGSYWATLSASQQAAYRTALSSWIDSSAWPSSVGPDPAQNAHTPGDLTDPSNLVWATDGYQTANGISPSNGVVTAATFHAVTGQ